MLNSEINITPKEAFADLSLAVDKEFARLLSTDIPINCIAQKNIPYAAEIMKDFICNYIDKKAKMQLDVINKTIEKTKTMAEDYQRQ